MGIPDDFGCILVAGLVSTMLYGITTLQTYMYYMHYCEDASTMKLLVAATWILDTLHVSFMCHMLYYYLITNYGVPTSFEYIVWSFPASLQMSVLVIFVVQVFFAHKIHCLCRPRVRWLVTIPITLFLLAHLAFGMGMVILIFFNKQMSIVTQTWYYGMTPGAAAIALADVLTTVSLCVLLYDSGSRSAFPRTKRLLNTLIIYAVNRCLLSSLVAVGLLTVNITQRPGWTIGLDFILNKLYTNSLLASLNTRKYLRFRESGVVSNSHLGVVRFANPPKHSGDVDSSKEGRRRFVVPEAAVIDITAEPEFDTTMTLRREAEV